MRRYRRQGNDMKASDAPCSLAGMGLCFFRGDAKSGSPCVRRPSYISALFLPVPGQIVHNYAILPAPPWLLGRKGCWWPPRRDLCAASKGREKLGVYDGERGSASTIIGCDCSFWPLPAAAAWLLSSPDGVDHPRLLAALHRATLQNMDTIFNLHGRLIRGLSLRGASRAADD